VKVVGPAIDMSETPPAISRPAPSVGEHTREILQERGWDTAEIDRLISTGVAGEDG